VSYGPVLNTAAVLLSCYGNVPPERAAQVIGMLLGVPVSAGWVDKAAARVAAQLGKAGFDEAMIAALAAEEVLAADETPVNVLDTTVPGPVPSGEEPEQDKDPEEWPVTHERAARRAAKGLPAYGTGTAAIR
jgi:Transposase IS66 family